MSNYTKENLIAIPPTAVPAGTLAMKVGNEIFTPGNIRISSGGMDFYKCASVDTANKTWSGYLAVLGEDGVYTFEETATTGLTYGTALTPVVDNIYSSDAAVRISKLWDGNSIPVDNLLLHASLSKQSDMSDSGQPLAYTGTVSFVTSGDRQCARIEGQNNFIHVKSEDDPYGRYNIDNKFTLAAWIRATTTKSAFITFSGGQCGTYSNSTSLVNELWISCGNTVSLGDGSPNYTMITTNIDGSVWRHMTATWNGAKFELYVDGVFAGSYVGHGHSFTNDLYLYINSLERAPEAVSGYGEYADVYLYDRVLAPEEISDLYNGTLFKQETE